MPSDLEVFAALCGARAYLSAAGELERAEAVDVLQEWAERHGLVREVGQDRVAAIMAAAFQAAEHAA